MTEHLVKCAKSFIAMGKAHEAAASCHDGMSKASHAEYHGDLRDAHQAMAGCCADLAQCCIDAAGAVPETVDAGGIARHASEFGGTDFSAAIKTLFADSDLSKSTIVPRPGSAPVENTPDADVREIFGV